MTARAAFEQRGSWMGTEYGEWLARKWFGDEIVDSCPRGLRGKNKGRFQTTVEWIKVTRGGWVNQGVLYGDTPVGYVERRVGQVIAKRIVKREFGTGAVTVISAEGETSKFFD